MADSSLLFFHITGKCSAFSCNLKRPSGQDRTAAERKYIAKAIRRRRRILQSRILSCTIISYMFIGKYSAIGKADQRNIWLFNVAYTGMQVRKYAGVDDDNPCNRDKVTDKRSG